MNTSNIVKTFSNNTPVLVNGKAILYFVKLDGKTNRMDVAKRMFAEYNNCFSNIAEVINTIRAYEKTNDFVWTDSVAYILHQA